MDYWLLNLWNQKGRPDIRYLPSYYLLSESNPEDSESISVFRKRFNLPLDGPCPFQWVIGFCLVGGKKSKGENHYCVLLFMPMEKQIHVLGQGYEFDGRIQNPSHWKSWGSNIWKNVATLHKWDSEAEIVIYEVNWVQNGYDCGATACQVVDIIWTHGFSTIYNKFWRKPILPCCHAMRKRIAGDVHSIILDNLERFKETRYISGYRSLPRTLGICRRTIGTQSWSCS
jgi:hypothetical protein